MLECGFNTLQLATYMSVMDVEAVCLINARRNQRVHQAFKALSMPTTYARVPLSKRSYI